MASRLMHVVYLFNKEKQLNPQTGHREAIGYEYLLRRPWNPSMDTPYQARIHFRDVTCDYPEVSRNLNRKMPMDYIQITWELSKKGVEEARRVVTNGLNRKTIIGYDGPDMQFCFGTSRDGHIKATFSYESVNVQELGIETKITSLSKGIKFEKYFGRDTAPHMHDVFGRVEDFKNDIVRVSLENGARLDIAFRPKTALNDGIHPFSERGAMLMAGIPDPKPGQGFGFTAECIDFVKGHGIVVPGLKYDAVFHDRKQLLQFGDRFWFGRLRDLHVGKPYLDVQTVINMMAEKGLDLLAKKVDETNRRVLRDVQDFDMLRNRFLARIADKEGKLTWAVERAAKMDMDPVFPALFRSLAATEKHELYDMAHGRIPIYDQAAYRYVAPEPALWNEEGYQDLKRGRLKGNCAITRGLVGRAGMWRQPNGTKNEKWVLDLVEAGPFNEWGQGNMLFLGADIIEDACKTLGTMDFDDAVIVTTAPEFVQVLEQLTAYPAEYNELPELADREISDNPYFDEIHVGGDSTQWNEAWFDERIEQELENKGVGYIANALMLDNLVSGGKQSMLDDLADQLAVAEDQSLRDDLVRRYKNLEARSDYVLAKIGAQYNDWIDLMKTGKDLPDVEEGHKAIEAMYKSLAADMAFPWTWTIGGFNKRGRIPAAIEREHKIFIARTPLCHRLQATKVSLAQVEEVLVNLEWRLARPLPAELKAQFPADDDVKQTVSDLRQWWYQQWQAARENGNIESEDPEAFKAAYERIEAELNEILEGLGQYWPDLRPIAVELGSRIYKQRYAMAPVDEKGLNYHFRDRLVWAGHLGQAFLDAIESTELPGIREKVHVDVRYRYLAGPGQVEVKAEQGIVQLKKDGRVIGVSNVPDGDHIMHQGMILVRPAAPALKAER
jgi:hypothetical protein